MRNGLPFSKPRVRLYGDRVQAQARIGDANLLMHQVRQFCDAAKVHVYSLRKELPDGSVVEASVFGAIEIVTVWGGKGLAGGAGTSVFPARLVWMVEGFVITPRSAAAPDGWGLPDTVDDRGTPGGPLREVIINRFPNNNYPDALANVATLSSAPLFCTAAETALTDDFPVALGASVQFSKQWKPVIGEAKSNAWHCHRPQLVHYVEPGAPKRAGRYDIVSAYLKGLFDGTNALRTSYGKSALFPAVRGWYTGLADAAANEVRMSGDQAHDSTAFRPGYQSFVERIERHGMPSNVTGENLASSPSGDPADVINAWAASPEHYDNIVYDWDDPNDDTDAGLIQLATVSGTLEKQDGSPITPFAAQMSAQIFTSTQNWVGVLPSAWSGDAGTVSWKFNQYIAETASRCASFSVLWEGATAHSIVLRGRYINLPGTSKGVWGAALRRDDAGRVALRVAQVVDVSGSPTLEIRDWYVDDVREGGEIDVHSYTLPEHAEFLGRVNFSASGEKAAFPVHVSEALPRSFVVLSGATQYAEADFDARAPGPDIRSGSSIVHVEFVNGTFTPGEKQELFFDVLACREELIPSETPYEAAHYHVKCEGDYVAFQDYDGEQLVEATAHVKWVKKMRTTPAGVLDLVVTCYGKLVFPDSSEFVYVDARVDPEKDSDPVHSCYVTGAEGFFTVIQYLDIRNPDNMLYVRHDLGGEIGTITRIADGAQVPYETYTMSMDLMFRGEVLKHKDNVAPQYHLDGWWDPHDAMDAPPMVMDPRYGTNAASLPTGQPWIAAYSGGAVRYMGFSAVSDADNWPWWPAAGTPVACAARHHANISGVSPETGAFTNYVAPQAAFLVASPDVWVTGYDGSGINLGFSSTLKSTLSEHDGHYVMAGEIGQINGIRKYEFTGDDRYFWRSSLDLKSITGIGDMSDNILPMGVI